MDSFLCLIHIGIQPDDDQLNRSKYVAPLNTYTLIFIVAPCISKIQLSSHTNKCTSIIYYLKSVLILDIKTLYSLIAPTCFDTTHVIIREHSFS
jgi:hypothetical protein